MSSPAVPRHLPLAYDPADSHASTLRLVRALDPAWAAGAGDFELVRFTDGITNTLLKIIKRVPGASEAQLDADAVLMRAYGNHTEILIDRERETQSHALLASRALAPPLLARFDNGLLYRFLRGRVAKPLDLVSPPVYGAVARRLAQWHAVLPLQDGPHARVHVNGVNDEAGSGSGSGAAGHGQGQQGQGTTSKVDDITPVTPRHRGPNIWATIQKWILALPVETDEQRDRRRRLQKEFELIHAELDDQSGLGNGGLVFAHNDLLSANVIIAPREPGQLDETVSFIDYEYATPAPAAFDIANHFAEWGGYDCDYNMLPTQAVRRQFLTDYVRSYTTFSPLPVPHDHAVARLFADVDRFRGIPGFYWGVWALIQATISQIDFDYASYAEVRLGEYWAWRDEVSGARAAAGREMPLRERRWSQAE